MQNSNVVVTNMISISGTSAYILFDFGASHSFVTPCFVELVWLVMHLLDKLLEDSSPLGRKIIVDSEVRDFVISFDGHDLITNLMVLDMGEFDVMHGMDWLSICHAIPDCFEKGVCLQLLGHSEFSDLERDSVVRGFCQLLEQRRRFIEVVRHIWLL